jgi:PEP-CTERM motif
MKTRIGKQHVNVVAVQPETQITSRSSVSLFTLTLLALSLAVGVATSAIPAAAGVLNSQTVTQLTYPGPCPGATCGTPAPGISPTISSSGGGFTGTWTSPAGLPWQGTFSGTGPYPDENTGTSVWNFSGLSGGVLPAGTLVTFGDLDDGSGEDERFTLTATLNGNPVTAPWLSDPVFCTAGDLSQCVQSNMPEYSWNPATNSYEFDGNQVPGNPTIGVWIKTNTAIDGLTVVAASSFDSFGLAAPTPEPSSLLLLGSGLLGLAGVARRKLKG